MIPGKCVFSIDVEDWFHILDLAQTPVLAEWDGLPGIVESGFLKLLDLLDEAEVRATCFFLGWIAQRYPWLVREARRRGHELASHGWAHRLAYEMKAVEFYADVVHAKNEIQDVGGREVVGYRCPGFSVTDRVPWYFDELIAAGYKYDSSVFPAPRAHGGMRIAERAPHVVRRAGGAIMEFPVSTARALGFPFCFSGGGYLRLLPLVAVERLAVRVLSQGRPVIFYVHPREVEPEHPRLPMGSWRRFKSYVNLNGAERKVRHLLARFEFTAFEDLLRAMSPANEAEPCNGRVPLGPWSEEWQETLKVGEGDALARAPGRSNLSTSIG